MLKCHYFQGQTGEPGTTGIIGPAGPRVSGGKYAAKFLINGI